ncbi:hypothetical protein [Paenibacillus tianjinensis]|uniref:Uncharacterized protein n=1 Tax=Paenibacillus tianjinensis TaxID=2810347 RepID=A0ABX7L9Z2_9BACL|nr:hypothetical protein [Paenibacillus tianjinensis]QSF43255.1 hypothetical protein JRJ22_18485 [Paenibacillus tianjinensis]
MNEAKQQSLNKIQEKMDILMNKLKDESNQEMLNYLAKSSEVLLTGITLFDASESIYKVMIDKYSAEDGYVDQLLVYETGQHEDAESVFIGVAEALNNNRYSLEKDGSYWSC